MGSAAEAVRQRIAAVEAFEAIKYGQRAMEAAGGWRGCTAEFAGAGWMIAQFEAGIIEAAIAVGKDDIDERDVTDGAAWMFKRGKKAAQERVKAAQAAVKAVGTQNQTRMAIAMAA